MDRLLGGLHSDRAGDLEHGLQGDFRRIGPAGRNRGCGRECGVPRGKTEPGGGGQSGRTESGGNGFTGSGGNGFHKPQRPRHGRRDPVDRGSPADEPDERRAVGDDPADRRGERTDSGREPHPGRKNAVRDEKPALQRDLLQNPQPAGRAGTPGGQRGRCLRAEENPAPLPLPRGLCKAAGKSDDPGGRKERKAFRGGSCPCGAGTDGIPEAFRGGMHGRGGNEPRRHSGAGTAFF